MYYTSPNPSDQGGDGDEDKAPTTDEKPPSAVVESCAGVLVTLSFSKRCSDASSTSWVLSPSAHHLHDMWTEQEHHHPRMILALGWIKSCSTRPHRTRRRQTRGQCSTSCASSADLHAYPRSTTSACRTTHACTPPRGRWWCCTYRTLCRRCA